MSNFQRILYIFIVGTTLVLCENDGQTDLNDLGSLKERLQSSIQDIPGINNLPINESEVPNVEEVQNVLKKKCEKNGGPEAFGAIEKANDVIKDCFNQLLNVSVLQDEIEKAKETGSLDDVFGKYCKKVPEFEVCVKNYTSVLEVCLESKEKESQKIILNVTKSLSEFVCHKSGDRIAMFIAEGGPDCLKEKQDEIQNCANKTINKHFNGGELPSLENLPLLIFGQQECNDIKQLQDCIVKELQTCNDPTPSNIVESLFKFIIKMTPCSQNSKVDSNNPNGASMNVALLSTPIVLLIAMITAYLFKL